MVDRITIKRYNLEKFIKICNKDISYFFVQLNLTYVSLFKFQDDGSIILMSVQIFFNVNFLITSYLNISAKKNRAAVIESGFERWKWILYDAIGRNISKNLVSPQ